MTNGWEGAADGTLEERYYPMQNWRADVVAVADVAGARLESVRYSSYGLPELLPDADYDHDGDVDMDDQDLFNDDFSNTVASADENWNGEKDEGDEDIFLDLKWSTADASGLFSSPGGGRGHLSNFGLRKGYAGYENDGIVNKLWHVRHRVLDSELGRWTRRDPVGYVDGSSIYCYAKSVPNINIDPTGLSACRDTSIGCYELIDHSADLVYEAIFTIDDKPKVDPSTEEPLYPKLPIPPMFPPQPPPRPLPMPGGRGCGAGFVPNDPVRDYTACLGLSTVRNPTGCVDCCNESYAINMGRIACEMAKILNACMNTGTPMNVCTARAQSAVSGAQATQRWKWEKCVARCSGLPDIPVPPPHIPPTLIPRDDPSSPGDIRIAREYMR